MKKIVLFALCIVVAYMLVACGADDWYLQGHKWGESIKSAEEKDTPDEFLGFKVKKIAFHSSKNYSAQKLDEIVYVLDGRVDFDDIVKKLNSKLGKAKVENDIIYKWKEGDVSFSMGYYTGNAIWITKE